MARSRNIKPGFFKNEELVDLEPFARLLYIGLWLLADRRGRLEDRPKKIKIELFPCDSIDIDGLLNQLFKHNFIVRYEVKGEKYIWIPKFLTHQNPHKNEPESIIPPAPDNITKLPEEYSTTPADSLLLIPDSGFLIPDSLSIPYREIVEAYNLICTSLKMVRETTEKRKKAMRARWNKHNTVEFYQELFKRVQSSNFLTGSNDRNWMADFDWLMIEQNMAKVLEGKYDNKSNGSSPAGKPNAFTKLKQLGEEANARSRDN